MGNSIPLAEIITFIPGHINLVYQYEELKPDTETTIQSSVKQIFEQAKDKVLQSFPALVYKDAGEASVEVYTLGYASRFDGDGVQAADEPRVLLPVSLASLDLDDWFTSDDDYQLEKLAVEVIQSINAVIDSIIGTEAFNWLITAHCLPDYCTRPEGSPVVGEIQHGTGGPAAYAIEYQGLNDRSALTIVIADQNSTIDLKIAEARQQTGGEGVHVAVLDTAFRNIGQIIERAQALGVTDNWLYDDLLYENPIILSENTFIAPEDEKYYMGESSWDDKGNKVSWISHGFSVSTLVRLTAPKAKIYLYRVLNDQGIGSIQSIVKGMLQAFKDHAQEQLVINCSFTISQPPDSETVSANWGADLRFIDLLFEALTRNRGMTTFIAAAGNEGSPSMDSPPPQYPGAVSRFCAVSALNLNPPDGINISLTYYSNTSTAPTDTKIGLAVFGGEAELPTVQGQFPITSKHGLVTTYIDEYFYAPCDTLICATENKTGFAQVAGTSYAAGIVSGLAALLLSVDGNANPIRTLQAAKEDPDTIPDQGIKAYQKALL